MRLSGWRATSAARPKGRTRLHARQRRGGVEQSLARLKTDYLDVVQFHASPSRRTLEEHGGLDAPLELRESGKVRFIGMSGTLPHLSEHIAIGVFDVFQIPYSAVEREHEAAIANASQKGAGIVIRGGAAKGAPTEGKQAGLQWERWRRAHLDDLLDGMTPYGVHSPLHLHEPRPGHDHRRYDQPGVPADEPRHLGTRSAPPGPLRRSQAPPRSCGFGATVAWGMGGGRNRRQSPCFSSLR